MWLLQLLVPPNEPTVPLHRRAYLLDGGGPKWQPGLALKQMQQLIRPGVEFTTWADHGEASTKRRGTPDGCGRWSEAQVHTPLVRSSEECKRGRKIVWPVFERPASGPKPTDTV